MGDIPYIRKATVEDAKWLAPRLRKADRAECLAAIGKPPEDVMPGGVALATAAYTMLTPDGTRCGIFGCSKIPGKPGWGLVWMSATDELEKYPRIFLRHSRSIIELLHQEYKTLWNVVHADNVVHIRWISWCGFHFGAVHHINGVPFIEFTSKVE